MAQCLVSKRRWYVASGTIAIVCVCALTPDAARQSWWNPQWTARRFVSPKDPIAGPGRVAYARFRTMGLARKDGADIQVVDERGRPLHFRIMMRGASSDTVLAYEVTQRNQKAWIYFGNSRASQRKEDWNPKAGLFLETRELPGPAPRNIEQMWRYVRSDTEPYGGAYRTQIFDAANPFGPSGGFLSIYTGYLKISRPGAYTFATVSSDASFVLIDGNLVCQFPGRHSPQPGRRGEFNGTVRLSEGVHEIQYLHANEQGEPVMELVWGQSAPQPRLQVVPDGAFVPVFESAVGSLERADGKTAADFDVSRTRCANFQEGRAIEVQFRDRTNLGGDQLKLVTWDFGDGITSIDRSPAHVYLKSGVFDVTLTLDFVSGQRASSKCQINVSMRDDINVSDNAKQIQEIARVVARYPFEKMDRDSLVSALALLREGRSYKECVQAGKALLNASKPNIDVDMLLMVADVLRDDLNDANEARRLLDVGLQTIGERAEGAVRILQAMGRIDLEKREDPPLALKSVQRAEQVIERGGRKKKEDAHLFWEVAVLKGDCYRRIGDYREALKAYQQAEGLEHSRKDAGLRRNSYSLTVEAYLDSNELDAVGNVLTEWEREFPTERLYGLSSLFRARYDVKVNKIPEAISVLETAYKVNPEGPHARDLANLLATLYMQRNDYTKAVAVLESLKGHYDDPAFDRSVQQRIDECRKRIR